MSGLRYRIALLLLLSLGTALLLVDYVRLPVRDYTEGQVADRDIRAPSSFHYIDWQRTEVRREAAARGVRIVFDHDLTVGREAQQSLVTAFAEARLSIEHFVRQAGVEDASQLPPARLNQIADEFLSALPIRDEASPEVRAGLIELRWSEELEADTLQCVDWATEHFLLLSDERIPELDSIITLHALDGESHVEHHVDDLERFLTVTDARNALWDLEQEQAKDLVTRGVSVPLASSLIRENLIYNHSRTEMRRSEARNLVSPETIRIDRGTIIVREGDVIDAGQAIAIDALQNRDGGVGQLTITAAFMAFCALLLGVVYQFGRGFIKKFSTQSKDLTAIGVILLLILGIARIDMELSVSLSSLMAMGTAPSTFWFMVPFAGGAMLVRLLVNSETTLLWILVTASLCGLVMEQQVLYTIFFIGSGLAAASALSHSAERVGVLKAAVLAGLINAAMALLINLVRAHMGDVAVLGPIAASQPLWDVLAAFMGGVLSGFVVLALIPLFELGGFVTDYKLLELANLNHPLLRQLMLRAPGSYHHSVTVAQLCEAAAEAVGANALQTRVACYFHDIGKSLQPQYFIENQRGGINPHDRLAPRTSARIIVSHVVDGAAIARQYNLPQPIIDGITQHHGTGLIEYFYVRALEQASPGETVDESEFRYPGELPNSRETGIIMLADRVEAACRTLPDKSAESIRGMIQKLVNSAITDGQLEQCPLTIQELYTVVNAFTETLLSIYHQRVEYPGLPPRTEEATDSEEPVEEQTSAPIITLEVANPLRAEQRSSRVADGED